MKCTFQAVASIVIAIFLAETLSAQEVRALLQSIRTAALRGPAPDEVSISGTVTDQSGSKPVRIFIKGKDKIRYEVGTPPNLQVTIYNANRAWTLQRSTVRELQSHSAIRRPTVIPILDLLAELDNPALIATDHGLKARGTQTARHISLLLPDPMSQRPLGRRFDEAVDLFVDPGTGLIVRTERLRRTEENMDLQIPSALEFTDYRLVGALAVPFRIINTSGNAIVGIHQSTLVIATIAANTNLPDSLFLPPRGAQ